MKRLATILTMLLLLCPMACAESVADVQTTVDFGLIQTLNPDCIGWLYQAQSGLNAPIMQHETDDWYRERAFDEVKVYQTGSLYLHAQDRLNDRVVVVRGQAREEGCLGLLPQWQQQEHYDQCKAFRLLTPQGDWQADVFACVLLPKEDEPENWFPAEKQLTDWLHGTVLPASLIRCNEQSLPNETDRMLFLVGEHLNGQRTVVMASLRPLSYVGTETVDLTKMALDARETLNGMVEVGPAGSLMLYAQNDPLFDSMRYESAIRHGTHRDFGGGGCGPTSMATIVANLLTPEELPAIARHAANELGTLFCACSVNRVYCSHLCVPYRLQTPQEYLRYLPVAMADFAAGNNRWEYVARRPKAQGTNIRFIDYVAEAYGLSVETISGLDNALALMKEKTGEGFVLASALRGSPYTNSSHFVVIAAVDDEYFYVLDSLRRDAKEYLKTDTRELLELLAPGVTRIRLEDYGRSDLSPVCYISRGAPAPIATP